MQIYIFCYICRATMRGQSIEFPLIQCHLILFQSTVSLFLQQSRESTWFTSSSSPKKTMRNICFDISHLAVSISYRNLLQKQRFGLGPRLKSLVFLFTFEVLISIRFHLSKGSAFESRKTCYQHSMEIK